MIPTVPFDIILSVSIGLAFAACARVQFSSGGSPWGRELIAVLSFEAIIFWPVALYYILVHPAWAWMYLVDPAHLPTGTSALVLIADVAALLGGYLLGWALLRARRERMLHILLGLAGLSLIVFLAVCRSRLTHAGDFAEYRAGHAPSLAEGKIGWALLATSLGVTLASVLVGLTLWEQGKRSRS